MATKKTKKFGIGGRAFGPAAQAPTKVVSGGGKPAPVPVRGGPGYEQHTGGPLVKPNPVPVKSVSGGGKPALNPFTIDPIRTPGGGGRPALVNQPISGNPTGNQPRPRPTPTGPMVPVRGGGMAPASIATMMKKGGKVKSASKRADGCAVKGKTRGRMA